MRALLALALACLPMAIHACPPEAFPFRVSANSRHTAIMNLDEEMDVLLSETAISNPRLQASVVTGSLKYSPDGIPLRNGFGIGLTVRSLTVRMYGGEKAGGEVTGCLAPLRSGGGLAFARHNSESIIGLAQTLFEFDKPRRVIVSDLRTLPEGREIPILLERLRDEGDEKTVAAAPGMVLSLVTRKLGIVLSKPEGVDETVVTGRVTFLP